jgi:hypothetical protein
MFTYDEVCCDTNLTGNIRKLSSNTPEESVLLAKRLVDVASSCGSHLRLISHVGVGDLG